MWPARNKFALTCDWDNAQLCVWCPREELRPWTLRLSMTTHTISHAYTPCEAETAGGHCKMRAQAKRKLWNGEEEAASPKVEAKGRDDWTELNWDWTGLGMTNERPDGYNVSIRQMNSHKVRTKSSRTYGSSQYTKSPAVGRFLAICGNTPLISCR